MATEQNQEPDIFSNDDIIDEKYRVYKRLGKGGYGEIYAAKLMSKDIMMAVKVERMSKPGNLVEEIKILKTLEERGCTYIPHVLAHGKHNNKVQYLTMELLGENLSYTRRKQTSHTFSLKTTMAVGMSMLKAIKSVHDRGYLHRDIKPGNFVLGLSGSEDARKVIIIDFGLSRRHLRRNGDVRDKRPSARWVGSRRYMSPNTHLRKDQGRRDDLWSFLYVLIEFFTGSLPWGQLRGPSNLDKIKDVKLEYMNEKLTIGLPIEFTKIMNHIKSLKFQDRPNYMMIFDYMKNLYCQEGGTDELLFEWDDHVPETPFPLELSETDDIFESEDISDSNSATSRESSNIRKRDKKTIAISSGKGKNNANDPIQKPKKKKKRRCVIQ